MTQATSQQKTTNQHPHRRLNVVPTRICNKCIHHAWQQGPMCAAGGAVVSPVNGESTYVTKCADKNADGECSDYVAIDPEGLVKRRPEYLGPLKVFAIVALVTSWSLLAYFGINGPE